MVEIKNKSLNMFIIKNFNIKLEFFVI